MYFRIKDPRGDLDDGRSISEDDDNVSLYSLEDTFDDDEPRTCRSRLGKIACFPVKAILEWGLGLPRLLTRKAVERKRGSEKRKSSQRQEQAQSVLGVEVSTSEPLQKVKVAAGEKPALFV